MKSCAYESTDSDSDYDSDYDSDGCASDNHNHHMGWSYNDNLSDFPCSFDSNTDSDIEDYGDGEYYDSDYFDYDGIFSGNRSRSSNLTLGLGFVSMRNYLNNLQRVLNDPIILARINDFNRFVSTRSANQTRSDFHALMQELAQTSGFSMNNFPFTGFNLSDYNRNLGLTASEISRLPRHSYRGQTQKERRLNESRHKCCICMAELELEEELILLEKCSHRFHAQCLESWLNRSAQCPICRCVINPPPLIIN